MTRYYFAADFSSDRDEEQLRKFLTRALEQAGEVGFTRLTARRTAGRPSINRPRIEDYIRRTGNRIGTQFTTEEIAEQVELAPAAVSKWMRRMMKEGIVHRHYNPGLAETVSWELRKKV